jgi:RNA polymerase sigma-70 factor (ECF subfamily)
MTKIEFATNLLGVQEELRRFAYKLTANHDDANDLLQETSLKVLNNQDKFEDNTNFKAWIYTIMRNLFINDYRKLLRTQTYVDQTENLYHLNIPQESGIDSPEENYSIKEIKKTIDSFEDEYGNLFNMHIEGYKYEEIAAKKNLPIGTVKSRIFLARKRLQEKLKDYK